MADRRAYFKVDVGYLTNPKVGVLLDDAPKAILLHLQCIAYSSQHLTDGVVPIRLVMRQIGVPRCSEQCPEQCPEQCKPQCPLSLLMQCGLIDRLDERRVAVHDYLEHQRPSEEVKRASDKGKRAAAARWADAPSNAPSNALSNASSNAKREERDITTLSPVPGGDRFEEFWDAYGKKTGRKKAEAKYRLAIKKRGVTEAMLIDAAKRYVAGQRRANKHPEFTKDPATWLNGEHWNDEQQHADSDDPYRNLQRFN